MKPKFKFKINDRVKYTSSVYGDTDDNPLWNGKHGHVIGTITHVYSLSRAIHTPLECTVEWDNGKINSYTNNDLEKCFSCVGLPDELFTM